MRDARHTTALPKHWPLDRLAEAAPRVHPPSPYVYDWAKSFNPAAPTGGDAVYTVANHGRWVVNCPDCNGAQLTHPSDRRFLCVDCGNAGNQGRYRPVIWPADHAKIEALLDARLDVTLQNWAPPETVTALRNENKLLAESGGIRA